MIFPPAAEPPDDEPVVKRDLIRYFALIAPTLLPHLEERPLNLQRFPDGAAAPGFWQKDLRPTAPAWLRRWREAGVEARAANEPPRRRPDGDAVLARQPGRVRDPRLDQPVDAP